MPGIQSLLNIGVKSLLASQTCIEVTGNNISNVNTEGYSRQQVKLTDGIYTQTAPGSIGSGVEATEVVRLFDEFLERHYLTKSSSSSRYAATSSYLNSAENLFNESNQKLIGTALSASYTAWNNLSLDPSNYSLRQVALENSQNLTSLFRQTSTDLTTYQNQIDSEIQTDVNAVNSILKQVSDLNKQITEATTVGSINPNGLLDQRNTLLRQLSTYVDINTQDAGNGNIIVRTTAGQTLLDSTQNNNTTDFRLSFENNKVFNKLTTGTPFTGQINFDGTSPNEYTIQVVSGGAVTSGAGAATFRVSLDGGKNWVKDDQGNDKIFFARPKDSETQVGDLGIYFSDKGSPGTATGQTLSAGDEFNIVPKKGLYWYSAAATYPVNVTPQVDSNGVDNQTRITGGALAGLFAARDQCIGSYKTNLDTLANTLIWETNRIHSQGAGSQKYSSVQGTYSVNSDTAALGSNSSGLAYGSKLTAGSSYLYFYNSTTHALAASGATPSYGALNFSGIVPPGLATFDPSVHTLNDVAKAVNDTFGTYCTATVTTHQLRIETNPGYEMAFGSDSAGLYAALGLNTLYQGSDASSMALNPTIVNDTDFMAVGHVNGAGEVNTGDNTTALALANLQNKAVDFTSFSKGTTSQNISQFYDSIVSQVGADTASSTSSFSYQSALAKDLSDRQDAVAGVNLDEEMSNIVKFQHSYQAAAKMISTADQLWQTVLGLKQ